eukprot:764437-Hanusia_phi.AAC.4
MLLERQFSLIISIVFLCSLANSISIDFENLGTRLYHIEDKDIWFKIYFLVTDIPQELHSHKFKLELLTTWNDGEWVKTGYSDHVQAPFPARRTAGMNINYQGTLKMRAVLYDMDGQDTNQNFTRDASVQVVKVKSPPLYVAARLRRGQSLKVLDVEDEHVQSMAAFALNEFAATERLPYEKIVSAVKIDESAGQERYYITTRCALETQYCKAGGLFMFGITRVDRDEQIYIDISHAGSVPSGMWSRKVARTWSEAVEEGYCEASEPALVASFLPWTRRGATIREDNVVNLLNNPNKNCWQRVQIISNELYIEQPQVDRLNLKLPEEEKWYTSCMAETLLDVLQDFKVPDVDMCVSEELPQILKGENHASLSMTISSAHMDIVMPDLFFRYWDPDSSVPHAWYKPPKDWSEYIQGNVPKWEERIAKLWWRGTVSSWHMSARGELVKLGMKFPNLIDAKALRVVGPALSETWEGVEEVMAQVRAGGKGIKTDHNEQFKFKYVISTHGPNNHWSNRFRSLLSSGAAVFKQEASLREFWELELEPFVHYIPVSEDLSDLVEMIEWAIENEEEVKRIVDNALEFVRTRLRPKRIICYWANLLDTYGRSMGYTPTLSPNASLYYNVASYTR